MHILGNVPTFYLVGAGLTGISGNANMVTVIYNACVYGSFILILLIIKKEDSSVR